MGTPSDTSRATTADRPRVLAVDDDEVTLTMIEEALEAHFEVVATMSPGTALEALRSGPFACVLADHFMPNMTGIEFLEATQELMPQAMRILMTAAESADVYADAVNRSRVHRLLVKPVRWIELPSVVSGAIREGQLAVDNARLLQELADANARLEAEVAQRTRELQSAIERLEQLASHDGLTNLYNRRYLQEALVAEISRAQRHGHPLSLLFIDVDHFKHYNDRNGHPAGDVLLQRIADQIIGNRDSGLPRPSRASDVAARYGGEEFVVLLPHTSIEGATIKAERLRARIAELDVEHANAQPGGCVSISVGVAVYPDHAQDPNQLTAAADRALYRAKSGGRNRVCIAGE